jgi:ADP-heptose:LPS heptosyltransferase
MLKTTIDATTMAQDQMCFLKNSSNLFSSISSDTLFVSDHYSHSMDKIAIIRRNGLGDLLCAYPLYCHLKTTYPQAEITLFVDERNALLLPYFPEKLPSVVFPEKGNKYFNLLRTALRYRKNRFDLAVCAKTSPMKMMNVFLFLLGAKKRVAVAGKKWHALLINHPVLANEGIHQALKGLQMVAPHLETIPGVYLPQLRLPKGLLEAHATLVKGSWPLLLLTASTTNVRSKLEEKRYADIVNRLSQKQTFSVLIVGQEGDRARAELISGHLEVPNQIVFPQSFEEFMVVLSKGDIYFMGDGGVPHIGSAMNKPAVVFFGSVDPKEWGPLNSSCTTFYHPTDVNLISEEVLLSALEKKFKEVKAIGREHL